MDMVFQRLKKYDSTTTYREKFEFLKGKRKKHLFISTLLKGDEIKQTP